ncbi:hypothetical protein OQA88_869 [Cercophora sp. LCS_1]
MLASPSKKAAFYRDARRFVLAHRSAIEQAQLQTYVAALVFSPTNSVVRQMFGAEESPWIVCGPTRRISGMHVSRLSRATMIWPRRSPGHTTRHCWRRPRTTRPSRSRTPRQATVLRRSRAIILGSRQPPGHTTRHC